MRAPTLILSAGLLLTAMQATLSAQATVEAAMGASRAATMTAPAGALGKSVSGIAGTLDKTLKNAGGSDSASTTTAPAAGATRRTTSRKSTAKAAPPTAAPKPAPSYEDPKQIQAGMSYDEVLQRFGPPALQITSGPGAASLNYSSKEGPVQVELLDGKVATISKPKS